MKSFRWVKQSSDLTQNLVWGMPLTSFLKAVSLVKAETTCRNLHHALILRAYCVPVPGLGRIKTRNRKRLKVMI